jgi:hypothetical protein
MSRLSLDGWTSNGLDGVDLGLSTYPISMSPLQLILSTCQTHGHPLISATLPNIPTIYRNHYRATPKQFMFLPIMPQTTSSTLQPRKEIQDLNNKPINN